MTPNQHNSAKEDLMQRFLNDAAHYARNGSVEGASSMSSSSHADQSLSDSRSNLVQLHHLSARLKSVNAVTAGSKISKERQYNMADACKQVQKDREMILEDDRQQQPHVVSLSEFDIPTASVDSLDNVLTTSTSELDHYQMLEMRRSSQSYGKIFDEFIL